MDMCGAVYFLGNKPISATCIILMQCGNCPHGPNLLRDCCCIEAANLQEDIDNGDALYMVDVRNLKHYRRERV